MIRLIVAVMLLSGTVFGATAAYFSDGLPAALGLVSVVCFLCALAAPMYPILKDLDQFS